MSPSDHFIDAKGSRWRVEFDSPDLIASEGFTGNISTYVEWVFANLGYRNSIKRVINYDTGFVFEFGETYVFKAPVSYPNYKSHNNSLIDEILEKTTRCHIMGFNFDPFSGKISTSAWNIGPVDMNELLEEVAEDWSKYRYLTDYEDE